MRGVIVDVVLFVATAILGSVREISDPNLATKHVAAPTWVYVLAQVAAAAALLWRRRHPYAVALVTGLVSLLVPAAAAFVAPYAVTAYGRGWRRAWAVIAAVLVCFMIGARVWAIDDPISAPVVIVASGVLGMYVAARRRLLTELADQARAEERLRLAGEMHDVLTHRINLMVLQAGALGATAMDPAVRAAAEELGASGRRALAELRDLLGVLRREGEGRPAPRGETPASTLTDLVEDSRAAGHRVDLDEDGDPARVAPAVRRTLYRLVQESLTNAHKHAPGAAVTVDVRYGGESVRCRVRNGPSRRPPDPQVVGAGGGAGLPGLRHRIELVGGSVTWGGTGGGGFAVEAVLPPFVPTGARR